MSQTPATAWIGASGESWPFFFALLPQTPYRDAFPVKAEEGARVLCDGDAQLLSLQIGQYSRKKEPICAGLPLFFVPTWMEEPPIAGNSGSMNNFS
jgi:hypothetical protein